MRTSAPNGNVSTQEFYDDMWLKYAHLDAVNPASFHRRRLVRELAKRVAPNAKKVVDVGCGQGELLRDLHAVLPNATLFGADVSEQSLIDSRKRNPSYDLFQIDLTSPKFETEQASRLGQFDLVVCSEVLEHIPDHELAASRLRLLVKPGGLVIVTVPGGKKSAFDIAIGHQRHYSRQEMAALLHKAGFRIERTLAWGFPFHSMYRTAVRIASRGERKPDAGRHEQATVTSSLLERAYSIVSHLFKPLFYLNVAWGGEQIIAIASRE